MLPLIEPDLNLSDLQGAFLTSGYSYLYALALLPVGNLADKVHRPRLLSLGLILWSVLTFAASKATSFTQLLVARTLFAAAQATQNPISFSLIPDLFPENKSTALAAYNCAIYLGRALSFAGVVAAGHMGSPGPAADGSQTVVALDQLDLQRWSVLYTTGDMAIVTPVYNYGMTMGDDPLQLLDAGMPQASWRGVLQMFLVPGLLCAAVMAASVVDPRHPDNEPPGSATSAPRDAAARISARLRGIAEQATGGLQQAAATLGRKADDTLALQATPTLPHAQTAARDVVPDAVVAQSSTQPAAEAAGVHHDVKLWATMTQLLSNRAFLLVTLGAALNDIGSYALISWQSSFYERVFELQSDTYAPVLAAILPIGGVVGGVGGGMLADKLAARGGRAAATVGASLLSAPFLMESVLAERPEESFTALLVGFALSEAWRAPSAVAIREVAPPDSGSTASALYLCVRNLLGGFGPLAVAALAQYVGLRHALLLVPASLALSACVFAAAEVQMRAVGADAE